MISRVLAIFVILISASAARATEAAWAKLTRGGYAVLMLHAAAPGTGKLSRDAADDCTGRRNLSDRGEQQAYRIGARIEARAVPIERVLTSENCESIVTARLAFGKVPAENIAALNPLPDDEKAAKAQLQVIVDRISAFNGPGDLFIVTNESVIQALTGIRPRATEAVIVEPADGALRVVARLIVN
jgi:phosphohistidine phosphatase SixA